MKNLSNKIKSNIVVVNAPAKAAIIEKMETEIDVMDARRRLMYLLETANFSDSSEDFKAECYASVFYALELMMK